MRCKHIESLVKMLVSLNFLPIESVCVGSTPADHRVVTLGRNDLSFVSDPIVVRLLDAGRKARHTRDAQVSIA